MPLVFGKMLYPWQHMVPMKLTQMVAYNCCAPHLLMWPAGGGKSAVQDILAVLLACFLLAVKPLSLGTNQANKKVMEKASSEFGPVTALFCKDKIKDPAMQQQASFASKQHQNKITIIHFPAGSRK
jgi:replication-associated recombination protein RarA